MGGQFSLDGSTITGIYIAEGSYAGIMSYPEMKTPISNNWAEKDGLDVDLEAPKLSSKEFEIKFVATKNGNLEAFVALVKEGSFHNFTFPDLGVYRSLRLVGGRSHTGLINELREFSLIFSDDFPLDGYVYQAPSSNWFQAQGYVIDGIDLSAYGIAMLEGSEASLLKVANVKKNLTVDSAVKSGVIYDPEMVRFEAEDVQLNLLMRAGNSSEFLRNYNALLYDLARKKARELYFGKNGVTYECYYKSSAIEELYVSPDVWCEFNITLCLIGIKV